MRFENRLKRRLEAGERVGAAWIDFNVPQVAEAVVHNGWPTVILDLEHGPGSLETAANLLRAVEAAGGEPIVRIPWNDPVYLKRILDLGASSLMIPMVESAVAAREAVAACRYPPRGWRGFAAPNVRASGYGRDADYPAHAHEDLLLILQIESAAAVGDLEEIAAVDGADMLFIGRYDLSGSIGKLGQLEDPEVVALVNEAERKIRGAGRWMATIPRDGEDPAGLFARGHHLLASASDVALIRSGARAEAAKMREAIARSGG